MDTYLMGDEIPTCPKCGARTEFIEEADHQVHTCLDCGYKFILESDE